MCAHSSSGKLLLPPAATGSEQPAESLAQPAPGHVRAAVPPHSSPVPMPDAGLLPWDATQGRGCRSAPGGASRPRQTLAPGHPGSPSAASAALQDKPNHQLIPGPAAADRQRVFNLAGPNKQLFFPAPSHQSQLTAFPPWSRVCFSP